MSYRAIKLKLYPNEEQKKGIETNLDNNRAVYNWGLATKVFLYNNYGTKCSNFDLRKMLTKLMDNNIMGYLKGGYCDTSSYAYTLMNLAANFRMFYKGLNGYPKFKKKKQREQKYFTSNTNVKIIGNKIKLPKLGSVKVSGNYEDILNNHITRVCISRDRTNQYYVSITYDDKTIGKDINSSPEEGIRKIGIDVGIRTMCTFSDGTKIEAPKFLYRSEKRLKRLNRKLGRESRLNKSKQSNTYEKTREQFARCYKKVANQRLDFIHKLSSKLVHQYDEIHIEDYHTDEWISKAPPINKRIADECLGKLRNQLEYKCEWYGVKLVVVDKYYPSTQICSNCGYRNRAAKSFDIHEWTCPNCEAHHDRDVNAATNILNWKPGTSYGFC